MATKEGITVVEINVRVGDTVAVKYPSRGKDTVVMDRCKIAGKVIQVTEHFFTVRSEKGYIETVSHRDLLCGHARLIDHRRGGKTVDEAVVVTGQEGGDTKPKSKKRRTQAALQSL